MTDVIYRSGGLWLAPDVGDADPEAVYMVECRSCHATSDVVDDNRLPVEVWTVKHTTDNPEHQKYRLTTDTFWKVSRGRAYRPRP